MTRIINILNFHLPKTRPPGRKRLYGDPRTGMDYETLFECQMELGDLMDSWLQAGCRAADWRKTDTCQRVEDDLNRRRLCFITDEDGGLTFNFTRPARNMIALGLGGGYKADAKPGRTEAVALFFRFITGPSREVGRCKWCRNYYWNRWGHRNKEYCGKRCATRASATRTTQDRRSEERQEKLRAAQRAIKKFEQLSGERKSLLRGTWTTWVAGEAGPEVTPNFITRGINRGELKRPNAT